MKFNNDIKISVIGFILLCFGLYTLKPSFMFNRDNSFKQFGLTRDKTIYPFWLVTLLTGIIIYLCIIVKNNDYI
jgi:hypothetical protein